MAGVTGYPNVKNNRSLPRCGLSAARFHFGAVCCAILAVVISARPAWAQETGAPAEDQLPRPGAHPIANSPAIEIGPGDLLEIVVFDTPELSTHVRVTQDGFANLPVIGRLNLNGMNADQAARLIEVELRKRNLLLEPHVTVFITEYASQGATVSGEVRQPGIYPTLGKRRLLDMLAIAGGLPATAGKTATIIHRDDPSHPLNVPLQATPDHLGAQLNPEIFPGDTIIVAKAGVVYIVGDVAKSGGFLVDNNERLSTAQALALAGGANRTAALSKTRLIRKVEGGREEYTLDLAKLLKGQQADLKLNDGDIIWVPSSQVKTFGYRGIEAAIAITSGLAIYNH
jgi:polysaccharide export outer membrane protein